MPRQLKDWGDAFNEYAEQMGSPLIFTKWAAIACVAGVLERKVWIRTGKGVLYPNMYTIFVAPPGIGKTVMTAEVRKFWSAVPNQFVASSSLTKASLIDDLKDAERRINRPNEEPNVVEFNSLKICSNELGVLLPSYENDFMNTLTDIYDGHGYSERRRVKDIQLDMTAPQINMLAATTPGYLSNMLPEGAWDQGFLSRTFLVYSGMQIKGDLFHEYELNEDLRDDLISDLKQIGALYGKASFEPAVADALNEWHKADGPPTPSHPKLQHYLTRRTVHLLKLCLVSSVMRDNTKVVTMEDYRRALDWLVEMESFIPDIFKSMSNGGDSQVMKECWHFAYQIYMKNKHQPVQEALIYQFLQNRVPAHSVDRLVDVMQKGGLMKLKMDGKRGRCYEPLSPS